MNETDLRRLLLIIAIAVGAHIATVAIRAASRHLLRPAFRSESKLVTISGFATSAIVFAIYFGAFGFLLAELGISLTTYLASASVIGLAVSFGSQGMVQDVITGLTVVFSDLIDVGDMVDIGGQVGIVESVGLRFTVLQNFFGARVFIPNRSIANVSNYPKGYVRAYLDARLPADESGHAEFEERLGVLAESAYAQFPGILLLKPTVEGRIETPGGDRFIRTKFRIWPGQGAVVEGPIKAALVQSLKGLDPAYADWMVSVHYRAESIDESQGPRLPRPNALHRKQR